MSTAPLRGAVDDDLTGIRGQLGEQRRVEVFRADRYGLVN